MNGGSGICDSVEQNIFDLYNGKRSAIKLATDAAVTVLKVDQVFCNIPHLFAGLLLSFLFYAFCCVNHAALFYQSDVSGTKILKRKM